MSHLFLGVIALASLSSVLCCPSLKISRSAQGLFYLGYPEIQSQYRDALAETDQANADVLG
jgi:hypothetical protein